MDSLADAIRVLGYSISSAALSISIAILGGATMIALNKGK